MKYSGLRFWISVCTVIASFAALACFGVSWITAAANGATISGGNFCWTVTVFHSSVLWHLIEFSLRYHHLHQPYKRE